MAAATVDHHNHLHVNSLPLIDVRLLSHSELLSLSLCSSTSATITAIHFDDEDQDSIPKIDASVFNESAGSRKQTFSRLRLAPRNSSPLRPQIPPPPVVKPPLDEENSQVISVLKSLLNIDSSTAITVDAEDERLISVPIEFEESPDTNIHIIEQNIPVELVSCSETKRKRGRPRKDEGGSSRWVIESESKPNANVDNKLLLTCSTHAASQDITAKRKPGRPRKMKNENENGNCVDMASVNRSGVSETGKRKPGRPRKTDNGIGVSENMPSDGTIKRKRGRPRKEESIRGGGGGRAEENRNGVVVNVGVQAEENGLMGLWRGVC